MNKVTDVKKLPNWAQQYIASLELEIKKAQIQNISPEQAQAIITVLTKTDEFFDYNPAFETPFDRAVEKLIAIRNLMGPPKLSSEIKE